MGAGGRAGRWAQARVAGVRTGAQGLLALGVGAGERTAGGRGAQALGRAGRAGVRGRANGRYRQLGAGARGRAAGGAGGRRADGKQRCAGRAGRAQQWRQARGLGAGRAAWAPGLARTVHSVHPT